MMDLVRMEAGIRAFLEGLGRRDEGDELAATPARVARAWCDDLVSGYAIDPEADLSWTAAPDGAGPVLVRRVSFASMCLHHLLPFFGVASVAYLPGARLAGLSKIGRVIDAHARRLQTQERLTAAIVRSLERALAPRGVLAWLEAEHTCMTLRGVRKEQSRMITLATAGVYEHDAAARRDVLALLGGHAGSAREAG
jgi:GTP cyclohydrolase I